MKLLSKIKDTNFNKVVVPKIIEIRVLSKLEKSKDEYIPMQRYLLENYNVSMVDLLKHLHNNFIYHNNGETSIVEISPIIIYNKYNYNNLIRLIDCGNIEIKGLHLVDNTIKYIQSQLYVMFNLYEKGGLRYGS